MFTCTARWLRSARVSFLLGWLLPGVLVAADPSLEEFLPPLSPWGKTFNVRVGGGYKDNLLLSNLLPEKSAFITSGLDFTWQRLPLDGKEFTLLVSAEDTRYPQGRMLRKEQFLMAAVQSKIELSDRWSAGLQGHYIYQDQAVDFSMTETNRGAVRILGHTLDAHPFLRWIFFSPAWLELSPGVSRQFFRAPLDDDWEGGARLMLGYDYGFQSSLTLKFEQKWRAYDEREQVALNQTTLSGRPLQFQIQEWEAAARHNWDPDRLWRTAIKANFQINRDNGPGFFEFHRYQIAGQGRYVKKMWEVKLQAKMSYYDFPHQAVSLTDPALWQKRLLALGVAGERKLTKNLKLIMDYSHERSVSNRATDEYQANRVGVGVDWEF